MIALAIFTGSIAPGAALQPDSTNTLRQHFQEPPPDTRPGCYWYWMNDNVSTTGITRDLEAMARVGIGRAYIGHIFDRQGKDDTPVGDVPFMSDAWWEAVQWAVKEAGRCGVEIGFFNAPGWSQSGGPWIKPSESMRYLGHSETVVEGGRAIDTVLPVPPIDTYPNTGGHLVTRTGPNFTEANFQNVRVVAFKQSEGTVGRVAASVSAFSGNAADAQDLFDSDPGTSVALSINRQTSITFRLSDDASTSPPVQSAVIKPLDHSYTVVVTAEESDDGKNFRALTTYEEQRGHQGAKKMDGIVVPLGEVRGQYVRLGMTFKGGGVGGKVRVAEIALSREALVAGYVRKQLGETSPDTLIPSAAYTWKTQPPPAPGTAIASNDVIDLTDRMTSGGKLRWDAPPGKWTVLRMGMIPIGTQCGPCGPESLGLEIDKMSRDHAARIFEGMVGEFLKRTPEADRRALKYVIADSYETGPQNWTDGMIEKFTKRFGYSPVRFLPVITGRIVDSPDVSDRFLWDLRRLIVESVANDYVGGLRDISNKNGLTLWLENYGHWGFISEFLLYGSQTDQVGGEFWESSDPIGNVECRAAVSAAHIYGKNDVYAEAFTSGRTFKQSPATLKRWCDWAFGTGINHMILHVYIHQPEEKKPGIIAWFGTAFNRHNTWFDQGKALIDYMRRAAVLLKAGRPVADVAYYIGENAPSMQGPMDPELPDGYDFDSINSDVLINAAKVQNGRITLPHGVSYAVLVLPKQTQMRPEVAQAIQKLVHDGAIVVGPRPDSSPSLQGYPECDSRVKSIADEVWGSDAAATRKYGKGWIYSATSLPDIFAKHGIARDVDVVSSPTLRCTVAGTGKLGVNQSGGVLFKHRADDARDIYFLSNTSDIAVDLTASFRQSGRTPSLWNAVIGEVREAAAYAQKNGRTELPLRLEPSESIYVVFTESTSAAPRESASSNTPQYEMLTALDRPWTVSFDGPGAPKDVAFPQLTDWSTHPNKHIQFYSGTATYQQNFTLAKLPEKRVVLQLGGVGVIATILVNDKPAGTLWTNPWSIDVTDFLREGENNLKIQVTNTWNNRLVGDAEGKLEQAPAYVSKKYSYDKANPLLPSGLLGPVTLQTER